MRTLTAAALLLALAACKWSPVSDAPNYPDISTEATAALLTSDPEVVVLDIRTPEEYAAGHLAGAVSIDCKAQGFADALKQLDPSKTYVMH